jgi:hypothetical protein
MGGSDTQVGGPDGSEVAVAGGKKSRAPAAGVERFPGICLESVSKPGLTLKGSVVL